MSSVFEDSTSNVPSDKVLILTTHQLKKFSCSLYECVQPLNIIKAVIDLYRPIHFIVLFQQFVSHKRCLFNDNEKPTSDNLMNFICSHSVSHPSVARVTQALYKASHARQPKQFVRLHCVHEKLMNMPFRKKEIFQKRYVLGKLRNQPAFQK